MTLKPALLWLSFCLLTLRSTPAPAAQIDTVAGSGDPSIVGQPFGVEIGPDAALYICEVQNHRVLRLDRTTGKLTTVAGSGKSGYAGDGGPARDAQLNEPYEVRFDRAGNMYFVEMKNHLVRRVEATSGIISTVAGNGKKGFAGDGGPAVNAQLDRPHSIALYQRAGRQELYIADIGNHRIRRVDLGTGHIDTFAGNGERKLPAAGQTVGNKPMLGPRALFVRDDTLWIALREGHSVWQVQLGNGDQQGVLRHVAGTGRRGYSGDGGPAAIATFDGPKGVTVSRSGHVYVVDTENQAIRKIEVGTGVISTIAGAGPRARGYRGDGGPADRAHLDRPHGVCVDDDETIYIGDTNNHRVRRVTP